MPRDRALVYARNREAENAASRAYYAANRDRLRQKMKERADLRRDDVRAYQKAWVAKDRVLQRAKYLHRACRLRAEARGLEFSIEVGHIVIPTLCPVLGIPIVIEACRPPAPGAPSVDRIDNAKGYTPGNVRVISFRANALKSNGTLEEMRLLVENWTAR